MRLNLRIYFFIVLMFAPIDGHHYGYSFPFIKLYATCKNAVSISPNSLFNASLQFAKQHSTSIFTCISLCAVGWLWWQQQKLVNRLNHTEYAIADIDTKIQVKKIEIDNLGKYLDVIKTRLFSLTQSTHLVLSTQEKLAVEPAKTIGQDFDALTIDINSIGKDIDDIKTDIAAIKYHLHKHDILVIGTSPTH